jgi:hypothetical protein
MITLRHSQRRFPALRFAALAVLSAAALALVAPSAYAGSAELNALKANLTVDIKNATSAQLYAAFKATIANATFNKTTKYGVVLGEALKAAGPNATDAGEYFGSQIPVDPDPNVASAYAAPNPLISLAAKTAGTGKDLNVTQIPDLTAELLSNLGGDDKAIAKAAAISAANKPGAGAILGGAASLLPDDAGKTDYAKEFIQDTKLASAAQDIVQWIAATVTDTPSFTVNVANDNLNFKIAAKIATGAVAGDPTDAGNIIHNLYNQQLMNNETGALSNPTATSSANVLATLNKGAATLAMTVGPVADIEEIQKIGNAFGQQIAKSNGASTPKGVVLLSQAGRIVNALATAVMNKPLTDRFGQVIEPNRIANKADEIAEVTAYVLGGLIGSPELGYVKAGASAAQIAAANKKAATTILALITNATKVKPKFVTVNGVKVFQGPAPEDFAADVAASVALTVVNSSLSTGIKAAVQALLTLTDSKGNPTTAAKINKLDAARVKVALDLVYANNLIDPNTGKKRFEDGNSVVDAISDPETDSRPFSVAT